MMHSVQTYWTKDLQELAFLLVVDFSLMVVI